MLKIKRRGLMLILSSPSGAGKTTLSNLVLQIDDHISQSVSYTTRNKRENEVDGEDYYFTDKATFQKMIDNNEFLEYATVFGELYGTPRKQVEDMLDVGEDVLFDIDWQGNRQLTALARDDVVSIFILPPSKHELHQRLLMRNQDSQETIQLRMMKANDEIQHWHEYDYTIINHDLDESLKKILAILRAERLKKRRRLGVVNFVKQLLTEED